MNNTQINKKKSLKRNKCTEKSKSKTSVLTDHNQSKRNNSSLTDEEPNKIYVQMIKQQNKNSHSSIASIETQNITKEKSEINKVLNPSATCYTTDQNDIS
mmetsp:Transcript_411/g.450  ORF Transcript_411/g.450 Transcript_411/m.450 type:complete len:100 (+) Transcript_411:45-344(+)